VTTNDCPLRLYVDTCVLSAVANGELSPIERAAVQTVNELSHSSAVTLFTSHVALEEISRIPEPYFARHVQQYDALGKVSSDLTWEEFNPATEVTDLEVEKPVYEELRTLLPDENDAQHLAQAKLGGIDHVLTLDGKTIIRYARELRDRFGILVFRPSEFVSWYSGDSRTTG
jgi:predicted nucleic acid-binding protein